MFSCFAWIRSLFICKAGQIIHTCLQYQSKTAALLVTHITPTCFDFGIIALVNARQDLHFYLRISPALSKFLQTCHLIPPFLKIMSNRPIINRVISTYFVKGQESSCNRPCETRCGRNKKGGGAPPPFLPFCKFCCKFVPLGMQQARLLNYFSFSYASGAVSASCGSISMS